MIIIYLTLYQVFLGIDAEQEPEVFEAFRSASSEHWHGVIAVPLNLSLPFWGSSGVFENYSTMTD